MKTYQDLLKIPEREKDRADFVKGVIADYQSSTLYKTAVDAYTYDRCRNATTMRYQKMITTLTGQKVADTISAVHRSTSNFFNIFTTQLNQYLLGNGVSWTNDGTEKNLPKNFDTRVQQAGKAALVGGVSYAYYNPANGDPLKVFKATEFAPLYDEETGELAAGVRFWQIDPSKPLRAQLFETDGLTNYMWANTEDKVSDGWQKVESGVYCMPKTSYVVQVVGDAKDKEDGTVEIREGEPLPGFPVVPLWANPNHQSELVGLQEKIDAYDFILNGWEDDLDNAQIYWIINGAAGMDDPDLLQFLDRLKTVGAAAPAAGQTVTPYTVEIPVAARNTLLDRLERQLYIDAMIMNPHDIVAGATTATQIRAAYEPQNVKCDQYEYCVIEFIEGILRLAGIEDEPTFTRSTIVNTQEEVNTVIAAAQYLTDEYITEKILTLLGDGDKAEEITKAKIANGYDRFANDMEDEEPGEVVG